MKQRSGLYRHNTVSCEYMETLFTVYILLVSSFSIMLFLYGFFPVEYVYNPISTTNDIPHSIEEIRIKVNELYQPMIQRVIIMIIDALRWDFIKNSEVKNSMPVLHSFIQTNSACILQAHVNPPTVTMPRIKALTSGTIPGYMDVLLNFDSTVFKMDNILLQTTLQGKKIVFYGDDTWLKLFPGLFKRYDGTSSFFVTDYTEVDNNVTRHIRKELNNDDWSIMILHYLGLDHIGHVSGPYSSLIKPKLKEMDEVIDYIHSHILNWNRNNISSLFVICGDHGMKDSGGHGGSTEQETLIPVISVGAICPSNVENPKKIAQIDLAATLSVLLGIPIPSSNMGSIAFDMLGEVSISKKLYLLYYNTKQVFQHFEKITNDKNGKTYQHYINAIKLHVAWLNGSGQQNEIVDDIVNLYETTLTEMKESLINKVVKCDINVIVCSIIIMAHILHLNYYKRSIKRVSLLKSYLFSMCFMNILLYFILKYLFEAEQKMNSWLENVVTLPMILIFTSIIYWFCSKYGEFSLQLSSLKKWMKYDLIQHLLFSGTVLKTLSLGSSSFIEEEHQTWYFLWTSFLILVSYRNLKKQYNSMNSYGNTKHYASFFLQIVVALVEHRIFRKLNSTGNKYAHLTDISDWLQNEKSQWAMSIVLVIGLTLLILIGYSNIMEKPRRKYLLTFYITISICIYLRHMSVGTVLKIPFYPQSRGINEIRIIWILIILDFTRKMCLLRQVSKINRKVIRTDLIHYTLQTCVIISAMLHRPYNLILLPFQILNSSLMYRLNDHSANIQVLILLHIWLGNVYYFYQGNSNSLATIDVAAGYIGLETYNPVITGLYITINTYSAMILSYLLLLYIISLRQEIPHTVILAVNRQYVIWRMLPMITCAITVGLQQYHLFIWTVFFPKLVYEAVCCGTIFSTILIMQTILKFC